MAALDRHGLVWQIHTGKPARGIQVGAHRVRFSCAGWMAWARYSCCVGRGFGAFWLILLGWLALGLRDNQLPASLSLERRCAELKWETPQPVVFGCWNLMLPAGLSQLRSDDSPCPRLGYLICDGGAWQRGGLTTRPAVVCRAALRTASACVIIISRLDSLIDPQRRTAWQAP